MKPPKFFVQGRYSSIYRIYCGYEAPVPGPIKPQNLSNEHDAHAFIIRLKLDHAFCLTILRAVDGLTVNSGISLAYSRRDLARLSWGWHRRIRFYPLDPFAYDFITPRNNHYPVIRPAQDTAPRGMACHFVPATILLMSDPNPADVTFFGLDEGTQARDFLHSLALTDEQLAMMIETLKLRAWPNRTDRLKSLLMALTSGNIVIVRIYDDNITPPKRKGPEDLPVEEYTPKPYTLGPHDEPGYDLPARVSKSATERRKENYQERKQDLVETESSLYKEQDAAAIAALKKANPQSIKDNLEYGGVIYRDKQTGKFGYTGPIKGTDQGVNPFSDPIPQGSELVGDYHTHADYSIMDRNTGSAIRTSNSRDDDFNSDNFSSQDIKGIIADGKDIKGYKGYLGTPSGQFKVYDPATGKKSLLQ